MRRSRAIARDFELPRRNWTGGVTRRVEIPITCVADADEKVDRLQKGGTGAVAGDQCR